VLLGILAVELGTASNADLLRYCFFFSRGKSMQPPASIESSARARIARADPQIQHTLQKVAEGNPLAAETQYSRLIARLQTKALLSKEEA
jgi:hypothetical protein